MAEDPDQPQKTSDKDLQADHDESVNPYLIPEGFSPEEATKDGSTER